MLEFVIETREVRANFYHVEANTIKEAEELWASGELASPDDWEHEEEELVNIRIRYFEGE
jgi:hypothetical protein